MPSEFIGKLAPAFAIEVLPGRLMDEEAREHVRALAETDAFAASRAKRKKVEMLFAHLKRNFSFRRLRHRGLKGATEEFLLAATAQNLKRLAKLAPA